jgi:hypothetical protein
MPSRPSNLVSVERACKRYAEKQVLDEVTVASTTVTGSASSA